MNSKFCLSLVILISVMPFSLTDFVEELVQAENYPVEKHMVRTKDGYILPLHRIPATHSNKTNGKVVLLQHPLTCSASCFVMFGRNSAAYYFARAGYDVWLGNNRGTRFARQHETMSPDDPQFWDFSWHQLGVFDLPATIDYILDKTNATKLSYLGHSQSVTILFVMLSELPEYNDKISLAHLMTPTIMFKFNHPSVQGITSFGAINDLEEVMSSSGMHEIISYSPGYISGVSLIRRLCDTSFGKPLCRAVLSFTNGSSKYYRDGLIENCAKHIPAGASYKQLIHYMQNGAAHEFQKYDHGAEKNQIMYGTVKPPIYNLSNVNVNIHMLYGTDDMSTPASNIPPLNKVLGRKIAVLSKFEGYGHIEFAYARLDKVYGRILKIDKNY